MKRKTVVALCAACLLSAAFAAVGATDASACHNAMRRHKEHPKVAVVTAGWNLIESEKYFDAIRTFRTKFGHLAPLTFDPTTATDLTGAERRAAHGLALAYVRGSDEKWTPWATEVLESLSQSSDPETKSHLAEAWAANAKTRDRAKRTLELLAKRDGIPDSHGWRLLATLRLEAGDRSGHRAALRSAGWDAAQQARTARERRPVAMKTTEIIELD